MAIFLAFLIGLLLGWMLKWLMEWAGWRKGLPGFAAVEADLQRELEDVQAGKDETHRLLSRLQEQMAALEAERATVAEPLPTRMASVNNEWEHALQPEQVADTQMVALQEQVASLTAQRDELAQQLTVGQQRQDEAQATLAQLQAQLTALSTEKLELGQRLSDTLAVTQAAPQSRRDDLEQIRGIGPIYEQRLFAAGIETFAQLAATPVERLREIIQPAVWQRIDFDNWVAQARQSAEVVIWDLLPYRLEEIRGIGPVYVKRLNAAGILTFADLAHTPEKRLREIIAPKAWQAIDFAGWIHQARAFAAVAAGDRPPLPLERIKGIGPVFATRLDLAGIRTFADLARCTEEELQGIIGKRGAAASHLHEWIATAKATVASTQAEAA
jgi:predicted flap endonuclease-1-like 5' DNA nuclease